MRSTFTRVLFSISYGSFGLMCLCVVMKPSLNHSVGFFSWMAIAFLLFVGLRDQWMLKHRMPPASMAGAKPKKGGCPFCEDGWVVTEIRESKPCKHCNPCSPRHKKTGGS